MNVGEARPPCSFFFLCKVVSDTCKCWHREHACTHAHTLTRTDTHTIRDPDTYTTHYTHQTHHVAYRRLTHSRHTHTCTITHTPSIVQLHELLLRINWPTSGSTEAGSAVLAVLDVRLRDAMIMMLSSVLAPAGRDCVHWHKVQLGLFYTETVRPYNGRWKSLPIKTIVQNQSTAG